MSKPITEKKFNEVHNFIRKNIGDKPAAGFDAAYKQGKATEWLTKFWPKLEEYEAWTLKYSNVHDLTKSKEDQFKDIYNKNPNFSAISDARMKTILAGNDITKQEIKDYYDFRAEQKKLVDKINKERYAKVNEEYTQANRAKDDSYFNTPLANEYAREHYLKGHPIQAKINEVAGKAAVASDFLPLPLSLGGPLIRTAQKWAADKDVGTPGTAADFAGAIIPDIAEKPAKMGWQYLKQGKFGKFFDSKRMKQIENRIKAADNQVAENAAKDLQLMKDVNLDNLTDTELYKLYNNVTTPEFKKSIEDYWKARAKRTEADYISEMPTEIANKAEGLTGAERAHELKKADVAAGMAKAERDAADEALTYAERRAEYLAKVKEPELQLKSGKLPQEEPLFVNGDFNSYYRNAPLNTISDYVESQIEPSKVNDALYQILKLGGTKAARSGIGGRLGQWDMFNPEPKDNRESNVNAVIRMFSDSWNLINKPEGYDTEPIIREAYDKWKASLPKYEYKSWRE